MSRERVITGPRRTNGAHLGVDPVACDGIGMCAHLAADLIVLDSWGYPMMPLATLEQADLAAARAAVAGCPRRALFLREDVS